MKASRTLLGIVAAALTMGASSPNPSIERIEKGLRPPVLIEGDKTWTLEERMRLFHVPGLSVAVFRDFQVSWAKAYGFADEAAGMKATDATLFQAGSVSKPVAAMGALKLVEEGKLSLDKNIDAYLKGWKIPENDLTKKTPVTLEMLLSHTGGLTVHGFPGYAADAKVPTVIEVLDGTAPANSAPIRVDLAPGTQYRYSGGGYTIAQLAMTDVTGQSFPRLLEALVLKPLGMTQSTYDQPLPATLVPKAAAGYSADGKEVPGKRHVYPEMAAAGLWSTPSDLARFGIGLQNILRGKPGPDLEGHGRAHDDGRARRLRPRDSRWPTRTARASARRRRRGVSDALHRAQDEGLRRGDHGQLGRGVQGDARAAARDRRRVRLGRFSGGARANHAADVRAVAAVAGRSKLGSDEVLVVTPKGDGPERRVTSGEPFTLVPVSPIAFVRRDEDTRYILSNSWVRVDPGGVPGTASRTTARRASRRRTSRPAAWTRHSPPIASSGRRSLRSRPWPSSG